MSNKSKKEYLDSVRKRYITASKREKQKILDEFCSVCNYNRKYAIRILNTPQLADNFSVKSKPGPKMKYQHPDLMKVLKHIWITTNLPCSKRLKAIIPLWLSHYPFHISDDVKKNLLNISPASIDRLMKPWRSKYLKHGLATTKPGSILKKHIPIKTNQWNEKQPGFLESDSVAHCGTSVAGQFIYTINCVDIASAWTEQRAVWGRGERGVREALINIEDNLPFDLPGSDSDTGSVILNWHLIRHFSDRKKPVAFTRSRPYYKNDNAHVEGKNWTHIRQYLGYQRFDKFELLDLLNNLYTSEWNLYFNFFIPSQKLIAKKRIGSKIIKTYDQPQTPLQRLLNSEYISQNTKKLLTSKLQQLDPFQLQKQMFAKIKTIMHIVNEQDFQTHVDNLQLSTASDTY